MNTTTRHSTVFCMWMWSSFIGDTFRICIVCNISLILSTSSQSSRLVQLPSSKISWILCTSTSFGILPVLESQKCNSGIIRHIDMSDCTYPARALITFIKNYVVNRSVGSPKKPVLSLAHCKTDLSASLIQRAYSQVSSFNWHWQDKLVHSWLT